MQTPPVQHRMVSESECNYGDQHGSGQGGGDWSRDAAGFSEDALPLMVQDGQSLSLAFNCDKSWLTLCSDACILCLSLEEGTAKQRNVLPT